MRRQNPGSPAGGGDRQLPARLDPRAGRAGSGRARSRHQATDAVDAEDPAPRRRTGRAATAARAVAGVLSVVLLAGSGWGWYLGQVAEATVNRTDAIPTDGNEGTGDAPEAMNLLLVGNDSRANLTEDQLASLNAGTDSGINTDTMILVHVPADGSRASFVSFPRDSYVQIPGYGKDKLNAAYAYGYAETPASASDEVRQAGGAQLLVQTISGLTGLQIDHYAEVDLLGFFNLSSVVGGVEVNLCEAVDDSEWSGAVFDAGVQTISGADALKFVRQRHGLPRGDFDRIVRQQVFIAGVLRKMLSDDVLLDLGKQRQLTEAASQSLTIDQGLDLFRLAEQMQSVTAGSIEFQTIPNVGTDRDEQDRSIIRLEDEDTLHRFFAELSAEREAPADAAPAAPSTVAPSAVTVDVLNGSGTSGLAAKAAASLQTAGFAVGTTGNADSSDHDTTLVRHAAGDEALAATLAAAVPGAVVEEREDATSGTVQLVLGSDFNAVGQAVDPAAPAAEVEGEDARTAADTSCIY
ncbi:LCP family protein [Geodermatophilus obscurus]|uniref:Cell envelope-related transcriptional attenuator n=1 Tax=Geodermatophilus obscurus (strain ATCC 25078 / DSM 43160 / JCM 3152 / CCUG 61914 / KCC A-0152 / KCTC 9177 / NBRC 13315 / NRRL B-3577 / G-20) TaxID=526225 RepID=D2SG29_GEOOG|nr:LCP family protein [Geodermatophilus obscurus]ADB76897.1 cell envelope-related transcriptional attenuator [Geodermatophilus obscurus DSM 43160]